MRSGAVSLGLLTILVSQAAASCEDDPEYEGIYMEESTQLRADEANCSDPDGGASGFSWVFYRVGSVSHPPVGQKVAPGFTTSKPATGFYTGTIPRTGGFGTHSGTVAG